MEWLLAVCIKLLQIVYSILRPIYDFIYREKPPSIPPIKDPLLKLSATTLAKKIRDGEISSERVVEAYIERIKEVNPYLNAVIEDRFEAALKDAKSCDEKLRNKEVTGSALEKEKPLYGVPITVKESCSLKGLSCTGCTLVRKGIKASTDSFVVECMKNAGAIPLCVTNTPEMCSGINSTNLLYGVTSNAYDTRCSAGGSSGGEGVLLGAGASLIGLGSDIAGSIRVPAHFNGVFGHKPTPGIISIKGHYPISDGAEFKKYLVLGPLTRYAEDLHLSVKILSSQCSRDLRLDEPVDMKNLKVYYMEQLESFPDTIATTSDIKQCIKNATDHLTECGADVQKLPQDWLDDALCTVVGIFFGTANVPEILVNPDDPKNRKKPLVELIKGVFGLSQYTKSASYVSLLTELNGLVPPSRLQHYKNRGERLRSKFHNLLKDDAVFILPTYPDTTFHKNLICLRLDYIVYCLIVNILHLPSTHVPMGLNKHGLPVGFQVIAGPHQDRLSLAVAKELEKKFGGWVPPKSDEPIE